MPSALRRLVVDLLPHGLVRRVSQRRELERREAAAARRAADLRQVITGDTAVFERQRLNMGCGFHLEPGWINADSDPRAPVVIKLAEKEPLPFETGSMEVVFSEHFLEHLPRAVGVWFLEESHRVLGDGGIFRVACPDLDVLIRMAVSDDGTWQRMANVYESIGDFPAGSVGRWERVLNWAFYGHEHRYMWSFGELNVELTRIGFSRIERMAFGSSRVNGAAIERRIPEEFYSLIVEATKC